MRRLFLGVIAALILFVAGGDAFADSIFQRKVSPRQPIVVAKITVHSQNLYLTVNGWPTGSWAVSTAGSGYHTPRGVFTVKRLAKVWFSRKYDNSPMPNSVFFDGGIAIHGSYHLASLGRPASHGCVRLHPDNAAKLFALVQKYGMSHTQVIVTD